MTNRYILNPDGTITKYKDDTLDLDTTPAPANDSPALTHAERIILPAVGKDVFDVDFGGIFEDKETTSPIIGLLPAATKDDSFGFVLPLLEGGEPDATAAEISHPTTTTYLPFNSYDHTGKIFADEFEILGGLKTEVGDAAYLKDLVVKLLKDRNLSDYDMLDSLFEEIKHEFHNHVKPSDSE